MRGPRDRLKKIVQEDLQHIPVGDHDQNALRMVYSARRRHDPTGPRTAVLRTSIDAVRRTHPGFEPRYDAEYFGG